MSNRYFTSFSDSPLYLEAKEAAEQLKNVVLPCYATAFASIVLPVPGGPNISTPFHGRLIPTKYSGIRIGSRTASFKVFLTVSSPAIWSKLIETERSSKSRSKDRIKSESGPVP